MKRQKSTDGGLFAGQKCKPAWTQQGNPAFERRRPLPLEQAATQQQNAQNDGPKQETAQ